MAYQFCGTDKDSLIESLKENGFIKTEKVENAMRLVDRKYYCPENPYKDCAIKIGFGATISAPHMHAICLEEINEILQPGDTVMDVGCGSGYITACLAIIVGTEGRVIGIDHIPELVELSRKNIAKNNNALLSNITFKVTDGRQGCQEQGPYNVIHVGAAALGLPQSLREQLKVGGRLVLPMVDVVYDSQHLTLVDKRQNGDFVETKLMPVRYVPLGSVEMQMSGIDFDPDQIGHGRIDMLNDDTLLLIFGYLMHKEWLIMESVCKRWFILLRQTWKSLKSVQLFELLGVKPLAACDIQYFTPTVTEKLINGLAERCSKILAELTMGCRAKLHLNCLNILARDFSRLNKLDLAKTALIVDYANFDQDSQEVRENPAHCFDMAAVFGNLKHLNLESCFDDSLMTYCTLESSDPILFKLFSSMPVVESVNLGHNTMLNGSSFLSLSTSVRTLDLSFCRRIQGETLSLAFSSLPNLRHVSLYSNDKLTGSCLTYLPAGLLTLDLSFCDCIETEMLNNFLATHHDLINLQLANVRCVNGSTLEQIGQLKYLEKLCLNSYFKNYYMQKMEHPHDITKGLKSLKNLKTLKSLDLRENDFVNDAVLIGLSYACASTMEDLNVCHLFTVSPVGFSSLGRLSQLKRLDISCNECVDETVLLSVAHGGRLEFVNARRCSQITEDTVKRLSGLWPNNITVFQLY